MGPLIIKRLPNSYILNVFTNEKRCFVFKITRIVTRGGSDLTTSKHRQACFGLITFQQNIKNTFDKEKFIVFLIYIFKMSLILEKIPTCSSYKQLKISNTISNFVFATLSPINLYKNNINCLKLFKK